MQNRDILLGIACTPTIHNNWKRACFHNDSAQQQMTADKTLLEHSIFYDLLQISKLLSDFRTFIIIHILLFLLQSFLV